MGLIDPNILPNLDMFGIFSYHFVLSSCAIFGKFYPYAYVYYNIVFVIILLWCIKETQTEIPLILAIRVNIILILFDIITILSMMANHVSITDFFSILCALLNLIFRFITIPLMSKMCSDKTGGINDGLPALFNPIFGTDYNINSRETYENIDNVPHQSYPKSETVISHPNVHSFSSNVPTYQA